MLPSAVARVCAATALAVAVALAAAACAGGAGGAPTPAEPTRIAERMGGLVIAPDLVFTTAVDGYELAPQSVGSSGEIGMSATWFNAGTGTMVTLRTERGELTAQTCEQTPLWEAPDAVVVCAKEQGVWHRTAGGIHEYVAASGTALIRLVGRGAPPADLLAAAMAVRVPSDVELDVLFSDAPARVSAPVDRGDLPEHGDGAPINPTGPGG